MADHQTALLAIPCLDLEDTLRAAGYQRIAGVDEVGRGCWAGPVYAAAVVLPEDCYLDRSLLAEVIDSKLLATPKRERLAGAITRLALGAAIGWAEAPVIDRLNIAGATKLAMYAALAALAGRPVNPALPEALAGPRCGTSPSRLGAPADSALPEAGVRPVASPALWGAARLAGEALVPDYVLTDALPLSELDLPQRAIVRGDRCCLAIAAASIIAKVARDAEMQRRAGAYPDYGWHQNKGYGTTHHARALLEHGLTPLHRRSFAPMRYLAGLRDHIAGALPPGATG